MTDATIATDLLKIDAAAESARIESSIQEQIRLHLRRRGVVLGLSGGIDSSVSAALATRALGRKRVLGLFMPEQDSSDESLELGQVLATWLGIEAQKENIGGILEAAGCYRRRDEAIRSACPEYGPGWKCKLVLADVLSGTQYALTTLVVESPAGVRSKIRLRGQAYSQIVAASNFKQRTRKLLEYYHADRMQYAVLGTPNRLEHDQGFFVKNGDGAADIKPIAHLYKSQVYQLAKYLGIPEAIRRRPPTTDTFSLEQTQEEFYFGVPLEQMDLCLYGKNHGMAAGKIADCSGLTAEQVQCVYAAIDAKRRATAYLHQRALLVSEVTEIAHL